MSKFLTAWLKEMKVIQEVQKSEKENTVILKRLLNASLWSKYSTRLTLTVLYSIPFLQVL